MISKKEEAPYGKPLENVEPDEQHQRKKNAESLPYPTLPKTRAPERSLIGNKNELVLSILSDEAPAAVSFFRRCRLSLGTDE